jgi:uncharacterized surface protein with fasciclin (FAS1) repeats
MMKLFIALLTCLVGTSCSFSPSRLHSKTCPSVICLGQQSQTTPVDWETEEPFERSNLDRFLSVKFPAFYALISQNDEVVKLLQSGTGITVFCPNAEAFSNLGTKKLQQLKDPRNLETIEKIGAYHIVADEAVPVTRLFQEDWTVPKTKSGKPELSYRGVMTLGGEVVVSRSRVGGFLGLFKEEDGGVVIGPEGKIVQSFKVGNSFVHEVNALVSPIILWRFMDQLRIPGT